jgi:hypothetical protein
VNTNFPNKWIAGRRGIQRENGSSAFLVSNAAGWDKYWLGRRVHAAQEVESAPPYTWFGIAYAPAWLFCHGATITRPHLRQI